MGRIEIEKTVKNLQANNKYSHCALTTSVVPASSINAIIHSENIKLQEEKHKSYLIKKQREREEEERRAKEKELYERPLKEFINKKIRESGLSEMDFKRTISSSCDYLFSVSTKAKYFAEKPELFEKYRDERLIRFSIKRPDGKVGKVEIYTENGELIFEQYKTLKLV